MSDVFKDFNVPFQQQPTLQATVATSPAAVQQQGIMVKDAIASAKVNNQNGDTLQIAGKTKKEGPIKRLKRGIANVKKFFATVGEYAKGIGKGVFYGSVAGGSVYGIGALANVIKKHNNPETKLIKNKTWAIVTAACVLAANFWKASLNATDVRSNIHDRYIGTENK